MAVVEWHPMVEQKEPILYFIVEYNTSFTPGTWEVDPNRIPADDLSLRVIYLFISIWLNTREQHLIDWRIFVTLFLKGTLESMGQLHVQSDRSEQGWPKLAQRSLGAL